PCFFHVDHHAWHHARFSTAAAQTHFSLEIRPGFRLISYWKRLLLYNIGWPQYNPKVLHGQVGSHIFMLVGLR
nr:hypothetical protein [Nitrospira sp.]